MLVLDFPNFGEACERQDFLTSLELPLPCTLVSFLSFSHLINTGVHYISIPSSLGAYQVTDGNIRTLGVLYIPRGFRSDTLSSDFRETRSAGHVAALDCSGSASFDQIRSYRIHLAIRMLYETDWTLFSLEPYWHPNRKWNEPENC